MSARDVCKRIYVYVCTCVCVHVRVCVCVQMSGYAWVRESCACLRMRQSG